MKNRSENNVIILSILITMLMLDKSCAYLLQLPSARIELDEAGMHRKLNYTIQSGNTIAGLNCEYMLSQSLPAAVYISTDELDDLHRLNMLSAVYPKFVDIEIPTEKASPFNVLLRTTAKITETLTLPIHFRYHAASVKHTKARVTIDVPKLFINCATGDNDLIDPELLISPDKFYCLQDQKSNFEETQNSETEDCNWQELRVEYLQKTPLHADIPVGNANGYMAVLYITIAVSWIVSIWTALHTQSVPRRINKQLNEQRIMQQQKLKTK